MPQIESFGGGPGGIAWDRIKSRSTTSALDPMLTHFTPRMQLFAVALAAILGFLGVAQDPAPSAKVRAQPATFYCDVLPILQQHCQVCHRAEGIAPMPLETFAQAQQFAKNISAATSARTMPPWFADPAVGHFSNDPSLTDADIAVISQWVSAGAAAGIAEEAPAPVHWAQGWTIPEPNLILKMATPVNLPASGDVDYTYEIIPTHFAEDRWVQMAEVLPSLRANVHHAVVYVRPAGSQWMEHAPVGVPFTAESLPDAEDRKGAHWTDNDVLLVYAPGSSPDMWPATMGKLIPAGADLVLQMHYTSNGHAAADRTSVGLIFSAKPPPLRVLTLQLTNDHFLIPPGAADYRVEARGTLPNVAQLLSFFPHMHLRGKRFEYNLVSRGAANAPVKLTPLLRVNYHFHWQMSYRLKEPITLPAGTELQAVAWFDNSKNNPHNPDPGAAVSWGEQTYDEMMVGFFDVAVEAGMDKRRFFVRH